MITLVLFLSALVILPSAGAAPLQFEQLIPLEENLAPFAEGLAPIKNGWTYGYVDAAGKIVIGFDYEDAHPFSEGLAAARKGGLYGYINKQSHWVIKPQYAAAGQFANGLAPARQAGQYGYIDKTGRFVIAPSFTTAQPFSEGMAAVSAGGLYGYIDPSGKFIVPPKFIRAESFAEGLAVACLEESAGYGYIGQDGAWLIRPQFEIAGTFGEGLAPVMNHGKYGYIDKQGRFIFDYQFEAAGSFHEKLAPVKTAGKAGYINSTGQLIIPSLYDSADSFSGGLAAVRLNRKSFYINTSGEVTISSAIAEIRPQDLKPDQWTGKLFTILPIDESYQSFGYDFTLQTPNPALQVPGGTNIRAEVLREKQVEVIGVIPRAGEFEVTLRVCDSDTILTAVTRNQQIKHLVLSTDLQFARRYFVGKTIYVKNNQYSFIDSGTPRTVNTLYPDDPLEVVDIWTGVHANRPIWLVAAAQSGDKVYIPIAYSKTNLETSLWQTEGAPWNSILFEQNPRSLYAWDERIWQRIRSGDIIPGMLMDQIRLAWGCPANTLTEAQGEDILTVWLYPTKKLSFKQSVLVSIKDR